MILQQKSMHLKNKTHTLWLLFQTKVIFPFSLSRELTNTETSCIHLETPNSAGDRHDTTVPVHQEKREIKRFIKSFISAIMAEGKMALVEPRSQSICNLKKPGWVSVSCWRGNAFIYLLTSLTFLLNPLNYWSQGQNNKWFITCTWSYLFLN